MPELAVADEREARLVASAYLQNLDVLGGVPCQPQPVRVK